LRRDAPLFGSGSAETEPRTSRIVGGCADKDVEIAWFCAVTHIGAVKREVVRIEREGDAAAFAFL
jgi:hypothetical protein